MLKARTDGKDYIFGRLGGASIDAGDVETGYDSARVIYKTPSFNGLTLGISYGADDNSANGNSNQRDANEPMRATNIIDMGAGFSQSFGDANVSLSAAMGQATVNKRRGDPKDTADEGGSLKNWSVGGKVTFGAITVGGTIAENNALGAYENPTAMAATEYGTTANPYTHDSMLANGDIDHSGMNFGISYDAPGPWAFSVTMSQGTSSWKALDLGDDNRLDGSGNISDANRDSVSEIEVDRTAFVVGAAQSLGKGVTWSIWYNSQERGAASASVFGTSLGISF